MSFNVGGMYVLASDRTPVIAAIAAYWEGRGARKLDGDALELSPLGLAKRGALGLAISTPSSGAGGETWIAVADSERYTADRELAAYLADQLATTVLWYELDGATDAGSLKAFGPSAGKAPKGYDAIESWVSERLPHAFTYFDSLRGLAPAERASTWEVLGFDGVPHRPKARYSGPKEPPAPKPAHKLSEAEASTRCDELVARRDLAGLDAFCAEQPQHHWLVLRGVANLDVDQPEQRALILHFLDGLLADGRWSLDNVLRAAARDADRARFYKACDGVGKHAYVLERIGAELLAAGRHADGFYALRAAIRHGYSSLELWNNLAWAMIHVAGEIAADERDELLAAASAHGQLNPSIHHQVACVRMRVGDRDRAIEAVRAAVELRYDESLLASDEDLAGLRGDPCFEAALRAPLRVSALVVTREVESRMATLMRPVLSMAFFPSAKLPPTEFGPGAAALLERFVADVPAGAFGHYNLDDGWKPLTPKLVSQHLGKLRGLQAKQKYSFVFYRGSGDSISGDATEHGVDIEHGSRPLLAKLMLPFEPQDPEAWIARFLGYAALFPYQVGGAGFAIVPHSTLGNRGETEYWAHLARARLPGAQHHPYRHKDKNDLKAPGVHWLTLLGPEVVSALGGRAALERALPDLPIMDAPAGGLCIRAARLPPTDRRSLGRMPSVARALQAIEPISYGDDERWYKALAELPDGPYDNG